MLKIKNALNIFCTQSNFASFILISYIRSSKEEEDELFSKHKSQYLIQATIYSLKILVWKTQYTLCVFFFLRMKFCFLWYQYQLYSSRTEKLLYPQTLHSPPFNSTFLGKITVNHIPKCHENCSYTQNYPKPDFSPSPSFSHTSTCARSKKICPVFFYVYMIFLM